MFCSQTEYWFQYSRVFVRIAQHHVFFVFWFQRATIDMLVWPIICVLANTIICRYAFRQTYQHELFKARTWKTHGASLCAKKCELIEIQIPSKNRTRCVCNNIFMPSLNLNLLCLIIVIAGMCFQMNMKCLNMCFIPPLQIDYYFLRTFHSYNMYLKDK